MTRISRSLAFHKTVFPIFWFGFLALFAGIALWGGAGRKVPLPILLVPAALAIFGYVLMRRLIWDLVDEVYDCGDHLLVRKNGHAFQVPLSNIMNVNSSFAVNPPRITLRLIHPGLLGEEFAFCPATRAPAFGFGKNPIAEDLMVRAHEARSQASPAGGSRR